MTQVSSEAHGATGVVAPIDALYRTMRLCRRFEEVVQEQFDRGEVPGPLHLSIGQEAVAAGGCAPLRPTDVITSTHRGHHHCIAKGVDVQLMMAELLGRSTGYGRGRGGSMHLSVPAVGLIGTNGIVGGGIPIATGAAFGIQVARRSDVALCFFGEGAAATGAFGESLNLASLWSLPIVYLCENNQYVELTPQSTHVAGQIWARAEGYGMPGLRIDGNDVLAVGTAVANAVDRAREGGGPTLIEAVTYRWFGHFAGDKATYRDPDEVAAWRERDGLAAARAQVADVDAASIDADVEAEIDAALRFALDSPVAGPEVLTLGHVGQS
ncbi:MAG: thiamine pyrophosphate-dependent dehydrogenase E1 component subunit alpha [Actinomycetota bacterium]|nr:thiamine pyrophosphate-dependent dehydrogenase E1 component subunit alpha [Actinomycetota bacterium]